MIRLPDARDQAAVEAALRSENPGAQTTWEFWAGHLDLRNRAESLSYGREGAAEGASSLAVGLESEISGPLDPGMRGQEVTVDIVIAGRPIRRFTGRVHKPQNQGFRATLRANTAGWWANGGGDEESAVKFGRERRFAGYTHRRAAEEILYKLPYRGAVEVEDAEGEFLRGASEPFEKTEAVGAGLDAVSEETDLAFADTRLNGCRGRVPRPAPLASDPAWTFRVGRDCNPEDFAHEGETKEWRAVQAVRDRQDGGVEDLTDLVEIPGSTAPEDATYFITVETEGPEAYEEGARKVKDAVTNLRNGQTTGTLRLPFVHALLEDWDVVEVLEPVEEGGVVILRRWLCRLDLVPDNPFDLTQEIRWTGTYREERLPPTPPPLPRGSGTVVPLPYVGV